MSHADQIPFGSHVLDSPWDKFSPFLPHSLSPWSKGQVQKFFHGELTDRIIGAAIEVHKQLGPGFLESIYEEAFSLELDQRQVIVSL